MSLLQNKEKLRYYAPVVLCLALIALLLALPTGFTADGLPIGVQLLGGPEGEAALGRLGMAFQAATDWHLRRPDLATIGL